MCARYVAMNLGNLFFLASSEVRVDYACCRRERGRETERAKYVAAFSFFEALRCKEASVAVTRIGTLYTEPGYQIATRIHLLLEVYNRELIYMPIMMSCAGSGNMR